MTREKSSRKGKHIDSSVNVKAHVPLSYLFYSDLSKPLFLVSNKNIFIKNDKTFLFKFETRNTIQNNGKTLVIFYINFTLIVFFMAVHLLIFSIIV